MRRALRIALMLLLFVPPLSGVAFYLIFNRLQDTLIAEHHYAKAEATAIKHAYASYTVYSALRGIGLPIARAEALSWHLGVFNERLEDYIYWSRPDPAGEKMRDLYNNWAGVSAAKWRLAQPKPDRMDGLPMMLWLLKQELLMAKRPDILTYQGDDILAEAIRWITPRRSVIESDVSHGLSRQLEAGEINPAGYVIRPFEHVVPDVAPRAR